VTERDPRWIDIPCTFTCEPLLFVLGRMLPRGRGAVGPTVANNAVEAARMLATELSRNVIVVDGHQLLVMLDEPFEAVAAARSLDLSPERCIASGLALELLREPAGEPSSYTWTWLCRQLKVSEEPSYATGLVQLGIGLHTLPPDTAEIPAGSGVWLWILDGEGGRQRIVFIDRKQTIGRQGDISLVDIALSRQHVAISKYQNTWLIEDTASVSGTYLEGVQIAKRCLVPGMVFHVGSSKLVVLSVR
jgi:hypothetical protein